MKQTILLILTVVASIVIGVTTAESQSSFVPPTVSLVSPYAITAANAASGAASAVRNVSANKTYQVTASTGSGTGTAVVLIQGTNDLTPNSSTNWDTIGTATLTLSTTSTSGSFASQDRYVYIRPNASTLTGTTATYSVTMGF